MMHHQTFSTCKILLRLTNNVRLARSQYGGFARITHHDFPEAILFQHSIRNSNANKLSFPRPLAAIESKNDILSCIQPKPIEKRSSRSSSSEDNKPVDEKPNRDKLQKVHDVITNSLAKLFAQPMDYSVYNPSLVFIDNIRHRTYEGLMRYVQQVAWLRTVGHLKFAYVRLELLNSHISEEEGRITVRWRISGISGFRVMLKFWKFRLWNWKGIMSQSETWYDGVSYFDVGPDGLVYRHIADKVMEDKNREINEVSPNKTILAAKLGVLASLLPQSSLSCSKKYSTSLQN